MVNLGGPLGLLRICSLRVRFAGKEGAADVLMT